jgi:hypothetical protein
VQKKALEGWALLRRTVDETLLFVAARDLKGAALVIGLMPDRLPAIDVGQRELYPTVVVSEPQRLAASVWS